MSRSSLSSVLLGLGAGLVATGAACVDSSSPPDHATDSVVDAGTGSSSGGSPVPLVDPGAGPDPCVDPPNASNYTGAGYKLQNAVVLGGGFVTGIEFSPVQDGLVYARTDVGGAYRGDIATKQWIPITDWIGRDSANLVGIESIAPDPLDANVVYLAAGEYASTNGFVLRSTDRGATWEPPHAIGVPMGGNVDGRNVGERLAVDPNLTSTLYFASRSGGLLRSADSGKTWTPVSSFPVSGPTNYGLSFVVFDRRSGSPGAGSSTLYVGISPGAAAQTGASLYRTTDGGLTWSAVRGAPDGQYPHHAAIDYATGNMYLTYNNVSGPNNITMGAVWKLDTSSDKWTSVAPSQGKGGYGGVTVDPTSRDTVVVSTLDRWPDVVYRTTDGGMNWVAISGSTHDVGGAEWLHWGGSSLPQITGWMGDVQMDPFHPARVLYNTGQGIWWSDDVTIPAMRWTFEDHGLEETVALGLISPTSGAHLVSAVGDIGGFRHDDLNMSPMIGMFSNPVFGNTTGIDYAEGHPAIIARVGTPSNGGGPGALSTDGGATWQPFMALPGGSPSAGSIAVSADGSTFVWAPQPASRGAMAPPVYSRDRGKSWTASAMLPSGAKVASDRVNPSKFYATSGRMLYASVDGGATFAVMATLPGTSTVRPIYSAEGDLWVAANGGGLLHWDGSKLTPNAGVQNATAVGFGLGANCMAYPVIYLAGQANGGVSGVFRSDDQGASWQRVDDPDHQYGFISYVSGDPRLYGRVYLGTGGRGIVYGDPK